MPLTFEEKNYVEKTLQEMNIVFPQKSAYVGPERLTALILKGRAEAGKYGFCTVRGKAMLAILMFAGLRTESL